MEAVNRYSELVYRIAWNYCKNTSDAEDIMQNTFLKLYVNQKKFDSEEHKKRWLIRVTINECHNLARFLRHFVKEVFTEVEAVQAEEHTEYGILYEKLKSLPEKYAVVVYLYYFEEYRIRDIAEILHLKETTVQTRLMRARKQLKIAIEEEQYGRHAEI